MALPWPHCNSLQGAIVECGCNIRFQVVNVSKPGIRVLIAEDHPIVADGIVDLLRSAKDIKIVGQVRNGAEAIELLKRIEADIALLDLRMPLVDAIGVMEWITSSGSKVRTVILTAFRSNTDVSQAIQAGAHAYLLKDMSADKILKTIRLVHAARTPVTREPPRDQVQNANPSDFQRLELDILALIAQGRDNHTIGSQLGLSTDAVKYRLRGLFAKLGVRKRAAAARQAIERGLLGAC